MDTKSECSPTCFSELHGRVEEKGLRGARVRAGFAAADDVSRLAARRLRSSCDEFMACDVRAVSSNGWGMGAGREKSRFRLDDVVSEKLSSRGPTRPSTLNVLAALFHKLTVYTISTLMKRNF